MNIQANLGSKKIAVLGPAYPYRGGIASFSERLATTLTEQGHRANLYTFTFQYPNWIFPGSTQYSQDPPPHLPIKRLFHSMNPLNWVMAGRQLQKARYNLAIWQFWMPYLAPCMGTINHLIARNNHTRLVGILHNLHPHEPRPGDALFTRYFINSCHAFVTLSGSVKQELADFAPGKKALFVPHPVYDNFGEKVTKTEARQRLNLLPDARVVLFFGLVRPYKGLDLLLHALAHPKLNGQQITLLIAGEFYEDYRQYQNLISQLNLTDQTIIVPHFIANDEVKYYFCAADIIAQPYRSGTQSGISQMAYQFERPMLVTDVGGLAEIVPHGKVGYVVPPENPDAIANALFDFYQNNREASFAHETALQKHRFSWEAMAQAVLQVANC
ncbi:MAG TPA: glycosyltransferase [Chitinophagales bacterium]|nr:glycosyltransferase [Chitinophagales bacterium]HRK28442.1 glycosyltransferase [Chitinophagales bacterium]